MDDVFATLAWWYVFYAPRSMPLPLPPSFLSIWLAPFIHYGTALLLGWMGVALLFAFFPRRRAVTGGAQMDGFIELLTKLVIEAGIDRSHIYYKDSLELPGYFRPNKKWDFIVVVKGQLVAALEAKSQVGPSFGNNFNNRTEEAMGSALDLWTAFREQAFGFAIRPWTGQMFFLEDCAASTKSADA